MEKKYNYNKISNYIVCLIGLVGFIYLILLFMALHDLGMLFNSDILSIPYLYRDLVFNHGKLTQWIFPPTMCFFPDVIVYFLLAAIFRSLQYAIVLFAIYQLLAYFALILLVAKKALKKYATYHLFSLSVFLTFFLYSASYLQQNMFYAPTSGGHFGTALMFLLGTWFVINSFSSKSIWNYIFLGLICFLTVFSDMLFLTQFVVTALISLFILGLMSEKSERKNYLINMAVIFFSSAVSYFCFIGSHKLFGLHIVRNNPLIKRHHFDQLMHATKIIIAKLEMFYQYNAIIILLVFIFFGISLVFIIRLLYQNVKEIKVADEERPFIFTILMLFIAIITGYLSLIFLDNNIVSSDTSLRHFQPFVLFPVFLGIPLYLTRYTNLGIMVAKYYKTLVFSMLACAFLFAPSGSISALVTFYPPQVACVDQFAEQYHLKNGVSYYWDAKFTTFFSKNNLNVVNITFDEKKKKVIPGIWFNTLNDYLNKDFNFVIVHNQPGYIPDADMIVKAYGPPEKILQCPDQTQTPVSIYLYKNGVINSTWTSDELTLEKPHHSSKKFILKNALILI